MTSPQLHEAWRLSETLLPDGERRQLWIDSGRLTAEAVAGADDLPGRFALPGLVDAHCHLALDREFRGQGIEGVSKAMRKERDRGVLLIRDLGAPRSVTLDVPRAADAPELLAAGRWLAPGGQFFPDLHDPVAADDLVAAALTEIDRGAAWIKIVADWRVGEDELRNPDPSYDAATVAQLVDAVHRAGARVAAHSQSNYAMDLVGLGVDSIEHGTWLDEAALREMAKRGTAWTPTLCTIAGPPPADFPEPRRRRWEAALANVTEMVPIAARLGITILAGTDVAGSLAEEVVHLRRLGLEPVAALAAATTSAREFLGRPALEVGAPADVVTYDADPREHPEILDRPAAIVLRGRRIS